MKKVILIVTLLLISAMMFGATVASLTITGTVNSSIAITVTEMNLPLDLTVSSTVQVGLVTEKANTGYTIGISSLNSGKLIGDTLSEELTYTATYGGDSIVLSSTVQEVVSDGSKTSGVDKALIISYTIVEYTLSPNSYRDTLTFTIVAK